MAVATDSATQHSQQKSKVLAYQAQSPDIPGDYTSLPESVPNLPPGVEGFTDPAVSTAFWATLLGAAALFLVLTRLR